MNRKNIILILVIVAILSGIFYLESRKVATSRTVTDADIILESNPRRDAKSGEYEYGKDISTPDGFINTEPFSLKDIVGEKVVLVDFWTYSCVNCQRTTPYLNSWHESYADDGLVIVGVHTPEFEFEKEYNNVLTATEQFGIEFPVVLDNDYSTWRSYNNRYWPRKYLIDIDGFIVYDRIGEGGYEETEAQIVKVLEERIQVLGLDEVVEDDAGNVEEEVEKSAVRTPEIYFGSSRVRYVANLPKDECLEGQCEYTFPDVLLPNRYALSGLWTTEPEKLIAGSASGIRLRFQGRDVNIVAGASEGVTATVLLDGVVVTENLPIERHALYPLVELTAPGEHVLEVYFDAPGVEVYTFTFG